MLGNKAGENIKDREDMTYDEAFRCLYGKNELVVH
jgi:hypothetical protein